VSGWEGVNSLKKQSQKGGSRRAQMSLIDLGEELEGDAKEKKRNTDFNCEQMLVIPAKTGMNVNKQGGLHNQLGKI